MRNALTYEQGQAMTADLRKLAERGGSTADDARAVVDFHLRLATLRPCSFTFDGTTAYAGRTDDTRWNGFLNVEVAPETFAAIVRACFHETGAEQTAQDFEREQFRPALDGWVSLGWGFATQEVETCRDCNAPILGDLYTKDDAERCEPCHYVASGQGVCDNCGADWTRGPFCPMCGVHCHGESYRCPDCLQPSEYVDGAWRHVDPKAPACFLLPRRDAGDESGQAVARARAFQLLRDCERAS